MAGLLGQNDSIPQGINKVNSRPPKFNQSDMRFSNPLAEPEDPKIFIPGGELSRGNKPLLYHQIGNSNFFIFITNQ